MRTILNVQVSYPHPSPPPNTDTETYTHYFAYSGSRKHSHAQPKQSPACLSYLPCCRSHIPPFIFFPDFFLPCFCSSQICTDIRTRSNTHGRTRSWEVCHYAAGSISGSCTQRKTTLICMCEMGFCAPLFT